MVKNNLTKKQANLILTILFFTIFIISFLPFLINNNIENFVDLCNKLVLSITLFGTITALGYMIIDNGSKDMQEKYTKLTNVLLEYFKQANTFYEVELKQKNYSDFETMFLEIVKNEGCTFYAELLGNKSIHRICKDSSDKIVYDKNFQNYFYFDANFKFVTQDSR